MIDALAEPLSRVAADRRRRVTEHATRVGSGSAAVARRAVLGAIGARRRRCAGRRAQVARADDRASRRASRSTARTRPASSTPVAGPPRVSPRSTSPPMTAAELRALLQRVDRGGRRADAGHPVGDPIERRPPAAPPEDTGEAIGPARGAAHADVRVRSARCSRRDGVDRFGLASRRPAALADLPPFADRRSWIRAISDGDLVVQACADDPQVGVPRDPQPRADRRGVVTIRAGRSWGSAARPVGERASPRRAT